MTNLLGNVQPEDLISFIIDNVTQEIIESYPEVVKGNTFDQTLINCAAYTGNKFIMLIDDWDLPIRETPEIEADYLKSLRMLFKGSGTASRIFAAAYMTGILPIKKDRFQSAMSDFKEYSMIKPRLFGEYVGFTEQEVKALCDKHGICFDRMRQWYGGYAFRNVWSIYNPCSVMQVIYNDDFDSYWTESTASEELMDYISKDYMRLRLRCPVRSACPWTRKVKPVRSMRMACVLPDHYE